LKISPNEAHATYKAPLIQRMLEAARENVRLAEGDIIRCARCKLVDFLLTNAS